MRRGARPRSRLSRWRAMRGLRPAVVVSREVGRAARSAGRIRPRRAAASGRPRDDAGGRLRTTVSLPDISAPAAVVAELLRVGREVVGVAPRKMAVAAVERVRVHVPNLRHANIGVPAAVVDVVLGRRRVGVHVVVLDEAPAVTVVDFNRVVARVAVLDDGTGAHARGVNGAAADQHEERGGEHETHGVPFEKLGAEGTRRGGGAVIHPLLQSQVSRARCPEPGVQSQVSRARRRHVSL